MLRNRDVVEGMLFLKTILAYGGCLLRFKKTVLWIRIRIDFGRLDPDPGEQKRPHNKE